MYRIIYTFCNTLFFYSAAQMRILKSHSSIIIILLDSQNIFRNNVIYNLYYLLTIKKY